MRKDRKGGLRKLSALVLCLAMFVTFMPSMAFADEGGEPAEKAGAVTIEGGSSYPTLTEALASAKDGDVLAVSGDITENGTVDITKDVTLKAAEGGGSINLPVSNATENQAALKLSSGKTLTLGDGKADNLLTITANDTANKRIGYRDSYDTYAVKVTNGRLIMKDGVKIVASGNEFTDNCNHYAIELSGENASGTFSGGSVEADQSMNGKPGARSCALRIVNGASADKIEGGTFTADQMALYVGSGATVGTISGGKFHGRSQNRNLSAVRIDNASVNNITDGTFTSDYGCGMIVKNVSSIGSISGGYFLASTKNEKGLAYGLELNSSENNVNIGNIFGGTFKGACGMIMDKSGTGTYEARVDNITGGTFNGSEHGISNKGGNIVTIRGGNFTGKNGGGIYSLEGLIDSISGEVTAEGKYGIWNSEGSIKSIAGGSFTGKSDGITNWGSGSIGTITGGTFSGENRYGIDNRADKSEIGPISGGTFEGAVNGLYNSGSVGTVTNGYFHGKNGNAVKTDSEIKLEPDLTESMGRARFNSKENDNLHQFNDMKCAVIPDGYHMSMETVNENNIDWHFLTNNYTLKFDSNASDATGKMDSLTATSGSSRNLPDNTFKRDGYNFTGWNTKADGSGIAYADKGEYTFNGYITLYAQWEKNPYVPPATTYTLKYESNGGSAIADETYTAGTDAAGKIQEKKPQKDGYQFTGWYTDKDLKDQIKSDEKFIMDNNTTVYAGWQKIELEKTDHYSYITGYEDGTVKPENNITRAETGTIFFRLLSEKSRAGMWKTTNNFGDVQANDWFNNAVSTIANGGIVGGYPDGTFKPNNPITRAEFATIAAQFDSDTPDTSKSEFTDISGHWAENYIKKAEALGYISGYPDGSFKPDQYITRAEAMSLINRVLDRDTVEESGLLDNEMIHWKDNADKTAWYYEDVQEATNSHDWEKKDEKEVWTGMRENRDWGAIEQPGGSLDKSKNPGDITKESVK